MDDDLKLSIIFLDFRRLFKFTLLPFLSSLNEKFPYHIFFFINLSIKKYLEKYFKNFKKRKERKKRRSFQLTFDEKFKEFKFPNVEKEKEREELKK